MKKEAAALLRPASIIIFCWGVAVSLKVSIVELIHCGGAHFRIVTAIKSKEKPILHKEIDKGFGLRNFLLRRLVVSPSHIVRKDGVSKNGPVSESRHNVLL
jgi:hypothetical protein